MKPKGAEAPGTPRAVIYTRVSSDEQAGNYSLGTQEEQAREFAARNALL